jgi:hypothetical protein
MIFENRKFSDRALFASSRMLLALMLVALATSAFATDKLSRAHCVVTKVRPAALSLSRFHLAPRLTDTPSRLTFPARAPPTRPFADHRRPGEP